MLIKCFKYFRNVISLYLCAVDYGPYELQLHTETFILQQFERVVRSSREFTKLSKNQLVNFISSSQLLVRNIPSWILFFRFHLLKKIWMNFLHYLLSDFFSAGLLWGSSLQSCVKMGWRRSQDTWPRATKPSTICQFSFDV